jgi:hypothetical protein
MNYTIFPLIDNVAFYSSISFGQGESNETSKNVPNFDNTSMPDLKYIWSVMGIESKQSERTCCSLPFELCKDTAIEAWLTGSQNDHVYWSPS